MPITLTQFYTHLKNQPLKPVYLIASDVTLLQQEARESLSRQAKKAGFTQRDKHFVESGFSWDALFSDIQNYGLFNNKALVEIKHPSAKFDDKALKSLTQYLENPSPDKCLVILTNKLTSSQQKARWHKTIEAHGISLNIRAITREELPQWINLRAQALKLSLSQQSIQLLTELTEGNLIATQQALHKLSLLYAQTKIEVMHVQEVISNNARYNVFDLSNLLLAGKTQDALRCLQGLKNTGAEPTLVLWSISREIRACLTLRHQKERGQQLQSLLQKEWASRRTLLTQALSRLTLNTLEQLLQMAETTDLVIKGQSIGNTWDTLQQLCIQFCSQKQSRAPA